MDYDYSKRGYLLPEGFKAMIAVIEQKGHHGFVVTARLPSEVRSRNVELTAEGNSLRIVCKLSDSQFQLSGNPIPFESQIEVPPDYEPALARASCIKGVLRIVVPKR